MRYARVPAGDNVSPAYVDTQEYMRRRRAIPITVLSETKSDTWPRRKAFLLSIRRCFRAGFMQAALT